MIKLVAACDAAGCKRQRRVMFWLPGLPMENVLDELFLGEVLAGTGWGIEPGKILCDVHLKQGQALIDPTIARIYERIRANRESGGSTIPKSPPLSDEDPTY